MYGTFTRIAKLSRQEVPFFTSVAFYVNGYIVGNGCSLHFVVDKQGLLLVFWWKV